MIYGFLTLNASVSNAPHVTNSIGELSEVGQTYAKSVTQYMSTESRFSVFFNEYTDVYVTDNINTLCQQAAGLLNGFGTYDDTAALLANATAALGTGVSVSVGAGILNNKDNKVYPEWVQFTLPIVDHNVVFKVWLANESWLTQYPKGEFHFVLPINDVQSLWDNYEANQLLVAALTPLSLVTKAQNETIQPVTGYSDLVLRVYKRTDHSKHFDMPISISINGGSIYNNHQAYIDAFIALLIGTGPHTLLEWRTVIPGLVALDKFFIVPDWANMSVATNIPNDPPIVGSPSILMSDGSSIKAAYFPELADVDVLGHLIYTTMAYKSYGLYILAATDNANGRRTWKAVYSDYFVRSVNDLSAGLMSSDTLEMSIQLDALMRVAETWTTGDTLPLDVTTVDRNNYTYLVKSVGDVTLQILTFSSWLAQQI